MTLRLFPKGAENFSGYASYDTFFNTNPAFRGNVFENKYFPGTETARSKFDYTRLYGGNPSLMGTYRVSPAVTFGFKSVGVIITTVSPFIEYGKYGVYSRFRFELSSTFTPDEAFIGDGLVISMLKLGSTAGGGTDNSRIVLNNGRARLVYYHEFTDTNVEVYDMGPASEWLGVPLQVVHAVVPTDTPNVFEARVYVGSLDDDVEELTLVAARTNTASGVDRSLNYTGIQNVDAFDWWFDRPASDDYRVWVYTAEYGEAFESDGYGPMVLTETVVARLSTEPEWTIHEDTLNQNVTCAESVGIGLSIGSADGVVTTDAAAYAYRVLISQLFALTVTEAYSTGAVLGGDVTDGVRLLDQWRTALSTAVADTAEVTDALIGLYGMLVQDTAQLTDAAAGAGKYGVVLAYLLAVADAVQHAHGLTLIDATAWTEVLTETRALPAVIGETVTLEDPVAGHILMRVVAAEGIVLTPTMALQQLLRAQVADTIQIDAGLWLPSALGSVVWAINARNGAATTYENYPYTSFARRGTHYLATSQDGLYRLDGDTDHGAAIVAQLESGLMQFAGTRFAGFKAIYLGMHGSGTVLFRLLTGDGKTYTYQVVAQNMENTKVNVGKGLRARYFAFSLETVGQDFDLDTVEFLPVGRVRRV